MIRFLSLCLCGLLPLAASAGDCNFGRAEISGRYELDFAGAASSLTQNMSLTRHGAGPYGLWIGSRYEMINGYSWDITRGLDLSQAEASVVPEADAICRYDLPDAYHLVTTCEGRFAFIVQPSGAITWASNGRVVGQYRPGDPGEMTIDLLAGGPAAAPQIDISTAMNGPVWTGLGGSLTFEVTRIGAGSGPQDRPEDFLFAARLDPEGANPLAEIRLTAVAGGGTPAEVSASGDAALRVTFFGNDDAVRRDQAAGLSLTATARWGDCTETRSVSAIDLMAIAGQNP